MADFTDSMNVFFGRKKPKSDYDMSDDEKKRRKFQLVEALTEEERKKKKEGQRIDPGLRFGRNVSDIVGGKVKKP